MLHAHLYEYYPITSVIFRKIWSDIGSKPRSGYYGSVLSASTPDDDDAPVTLCYSARPGLRVWRADCSGKVSATLNFKQSLADSTPTLVLSR